MYVHVTTVTVENKKLLRILSVCVCSLSYPACNAHVPYCHLWLVLLYSIFPTLSHERQDFPKNFIENKICVLILSTLLSATF